MMLSRLVIPQTVAAEKSAPLTHWCRLGQRSLLCCGHLPFALGSGDSITINGIPAQKPYLGTLVEEQGQKMTLLQLFLPEGQAVGEVREIAIHRADGKLVWQLPHQAVEEVFFQHLSAATLKRLIYVLFNSVRTQPSLASDPIFAARCTEARQALTEADGGIPHGVWLASGALYIEAVLPPQDYGTSSLLITSPHGVMVVPVQMGPTLQDGRVACLLFWKDATTTRLTQGSLTLVTPTKLLTLSGTLPGHTPSPASWLHTIAQRPPLERQRLREYVARTLVEQRSALEQEELRQLLHHLQHFITVPASSTANPEHPFGMAAEYAIPLGEKEIFLAGWQHDPLGLVEKETLMADLGFAIPTEGLFRYPRPDVATLYESSAYPASGNCAGFAGFLPAPREILESDGLATLRGFRMEVSLKGGLHYFLNPPLASLDALVNRDQLLQKLAPQVVHQPKAEAAVQRAITTLHQEALRHFRLIDRLAFGTPEKGAKLTIILPFADTLAQVKTQVAALTADPFVRENAELIGVLSGVERQPAAAALCEEIAKLYGWPMTLLVASPFPSVAAAYQLAAHEASAPLLLFLHPQLLPPETSWLAALLKAFAKSPEAGCMSVKTLYRDGSIRHAGLRLGEDGLEPLYHGYPADFASSLKSGPVDAVSGEAVLVDKVFFECLEGFDTRYLTEDFAVADFCRRTAAAGKKAYYHAETICYRLEEGDAPAQAPDFPASRYDRRRFAENSAKPATAAKNGTRKKA